MHNKNLNLPAERETYRAFLRNLRESWQNRNPQDLVKFLNQITIIDHAIALDEKLPTIYQSAEQDAEMNADVIFVELSRISFLTNVKQTMSAGQMRITSDLITTDPELSRLTYAHLHVCITRALTGSFGPVFNAVYGTVVCGWLRTYANEMKVRRMQLKRSVYNDKQLPEPKGAPVPEYIRELMKSLSAKKGGPASNPPATESKPRRYSQMEMLHFSIMEDFDRIWKEQKGVHDGATRAIEFEGKVLTSYEYCEIRIKQIQEGEQP